MLPSLGSGTDRRAAMRVRLKGIHKVRSRLADGSVREYLYAYRGGPRLTAKPGTAAFLREYEEACKNRKRPPEGTLFGLIASYRASTEFTSRAESTQKEYRRYLKLIEEAFGEMEIEALEARGARGMFKEWRDSMSDRPRTADAAWTMLARVLSVAKDRGRIAVNPCERGGRLYTADRKDALWTEELIGRFLAHASPQLRLAMLMALWTGQRQGDLLRLTWEAYDGRAIRLRQKKTGARLVVPVGKPLREALDQERQARTDQAIATIQILLNSRNQAWSSDGFRTSWGKACKAAGVKGVTFHDLRGSAVTRLAVAGCTVPEIAAISGHSLKDVEDILQAHYLGRDVRLAESAIRKLERKTKRSVM